MPGARSRLADLFPLSFWRDALAAFGHATFNNSATAGGGHTLEKAVHFGNALLFGVKCSVGHRYSNVNKNIIWDVIKALPELKTQIRNILDLESKT